MLRADFPRLTGATIALDYETRDPNLDSRGPGWCFEGREHGHVAGVALDWGEGRGYWPVGHEAGPNLNEKKVARWLRDLMKDTSNTWIVHNRLYDEGWTWRWIGAPIKGKVYDTLTAAPLLNEYRRSYSLDSLGEDYLKERKDTAALEEWIRRQGWKGKWQLHLWRAPGSVVAPYATQDAALTRKLWAVMEPELRKQDLMKIFALETRLLPVLLSMRWKGIRVDEERAEAANKELEAIASKLQLKLDRMAGRHVAVSSAEDVAKVCDRLGIKYRRTPTGKPSFTKAWYKDHPHEFPRLMGQVRRLEKARGTFLKGYIFNKAVGGRVHPEFIPQASDEGGAITGRTSSVHPNFQNLPNPEKDAELGELVRGLILPEEGGVWYSSDYSQQEPRMAVHFAAAARLRGGREAARRYLENPNTDFHQMVADLAGIDRGRAKIINLAQMYGQGGAALCRALGLPTEWIEITRNGKKVKLEVAGPEGQAIIDQYNAGAPFVRALSKECQRRAERRGYIKTLVGRKCRFGEEFSWYYTAMNKLVQGSSADQTKIAMCDLFDAGITMHVNVHDEIGGTAYGPEEVRTIREIMVNCVELEVPSKVDVALGPSWGAAKEGEFKWTA